METDKKELKILALRERISALTTEYEDRTADLRVELTVVSNELDETRRQLAEVQTALQSAQNPVEIVEGTVEDKDTSTES